MQTLILVGEERAAGDDGEPLGVPDAAPDEAAVREGLGGGEGAAVVAGSETGVTADASKVFVQAVVVGNPCGVGEVAGSIGKGTASF